MYWAIAGDPNKPYTQRFDAIIKNHELWNRWAPLFFPTKPGDKKDEKKILGLAIEKEGLNMIALAPKCYTIFGPEYIENEKDVCKEMSINTVMLKEEEKCKKEYKTFIAKMKGVSQRQNKVSYEDYENVVESGNPVMGQNTYLAYKPKVGEVMLSMSKIALSAVHTKMIVQQNGACHPFLHFQDEEFEHLLNEAEKDATTDINLNRLKEIAKRRGRGEKEVLELEERMREWLEAKYNKMLDEAERIDFENDMNYYDKYGTFPDADPPDEYLIEIWEDEEREERIRKQKKRAIKRTKIQRKISKTNPNNV